MGLSIAATALAECGSRVSIALINHAGRPRVFPQGDTAVPHRVTPAAIGVA